MSILAINVRNPFRGKLREIIERSVVSALTPPRRAAGLHRTKRA